LSYDAVGVRVGGGRLHRQHRGVYAVGHANLTLEARFLAAVKACGPQADRETARACADSLETVISTNQLKNGNHIEVDGTVFKVLEFQHVKPGKGGAFVRTKLKRAADGAVIDKTFRAGEKFRQVQSEGKRMQFLYSDGTDAHFMDNQT